MILQAKMDCIDYLAMRVSLLEGALIEERAKTLLAQTGENDWAKITKAAIKQLHEEGLL